MLTYSEPQFLSSAENQAWPNGYTDDIRPLSMGRGRRVSVCCCPYSRASQQEGCECLSYTSVHLTTCSDITPLCLISPAHLPRAAPPSCHRHAYALRLAAIPSCCEWFTCLCLLRVCWCFSTSAFPSLSPAPATAEPLVTR